MTTATGPPATAATDTSVTSDQYFEKSVQKPEKAHERPGSTSSNDSGAADLEKQHEDDGGPVRPVQSSTESVYPGGRETVAVMIALILTIFLVALVRFLEPKQRNSC